MKKLSIITINYNDAKGIQRTIESVVNQTSLEFEYIVIDGGSTDGSVEIIRKHEKSIDFWISEPDSGIYNAMNKGIKKATGEYLFFLNSGDHFFNNTIIKESLQYLENFGLVYFNVQMIGKNSSNIVSYPEKLRFSDFYFNGLCHQSVFIKKDLFEVVGLYDENLKIVSDWKFFILALFRYNCSYIKIDKTLSTYYLGGISSQMNHSEERNQVLNEYFSQYVLDYEEIKFYRELELLKTNRFKMLSEIEKSAIGRKMVSAFFRTYILLFSNKKLKKILN